jgi:hypothetical protein
MEKNLLKYHTDMLAETICHWIFSIQSESIQIEWKQLRREKPFKNPITGRNTMGQKTRV